MSKNARGDPKETAVRQAGVKWSFEFEKRVRLFGDTEGSREPMNVPLLYGATWERRSQRDPGGRLSKGSK